MAKAEKQPDITERLMVVCDKTHPHYGCTGHLNGKIIRLFGKPMAEVEFTNCAHMGTGCFVSPGQIRRV